MDPFNAIGGLILGWLKNKALQGWIKLLFTMFFSAGVSFLFICGSMLVSTRDWAVSIGTGMIVSSITVTVLFRTSPLTKKMMVVLPADEAKQEIQTDVQIINKGG